VAKKPTKSPQSNKNIPVAKEVAVSKPNSTAKATQSKTNSLVAQAKEFAAASKSNVLLRGKLVTSNVSKTAPSKKKISATAKAKENTTVKPSKSIVMPEKVTSNGSKAAPNKKNISATTKTKENAAAKPSKSSNVPEKVTNNGSKRASTNKKGSATAKAKENAVPSKSKGVVIPEKVTSNGSKTPPNNKIISVTAETKEKQNNAGKCNLKKGTNKGSAKSTAAATSKVNKEPEEENTCSIPLVSSSMTIAQLKEECTTRNPCIKGISGKNKSWLLSHLGEGSEVQGSDEWKAKKQADRHGEMDRQKVLHSNKYPYVHKCPLAKSSALMLHGTPRLAKSSVECDLCWEETCYDTFRSPGTPIYTCEPCNWDICQTCFNEKNKSLEEKEQIRREMRRLAEEERVRREKEEARRQKEYARRQKEEEKRWNAPKRFKNVIINPSHIHLDPDSSTLKYTVWCSDGYDNDRWHSYEGPPSREFDSVWKSKKEANDRAEYLFFWKNPWGTAPNQVSDDGGDPEPSDVDGLNSWTVSPDDTSRWSVGAVPADAFAHLPNAQKHRHNHDDGQEPQGYEEESSDLCF